MANGTFEPEYPRLPIWEDDPGDEGHGLSSFALEDGVVYHVYSTYGRGTDAFNTFYQLIDRAPKGRDEDDIPAGEWVAPSRRVRGRLGGEP